MWVNKKYKGKFLGNNEYDKKANLTPSGRVFKLKNSKTGKETKPYRSPEHAKAHGWKKCVK